MKRLFGLLPNQAQFLKDGYLRRLLGSLDDESGQILVLAVGTMTFVLALAAIAIDVGFWAQTKRDLQKDADAIVLAAVRELPKEAAAEEIALSTPLPMANCKTY